MMCFAWNLLGCRRNGDPGGSSGKSFPGVGWFAAMDMAIERAADGSVAGSSCLRASVCGR